MTDLLAKVIQQTISEQMQINQEQIQKTIFANTNNNMDFNEIYCKMIWNSISISINMSIQIFMDLLTNANIITPVDETALRKILLSLVKD